MIAAGLRKIFWGLIFVIVDFRLSGFDILPDTIGFILISFGLSSLKELHPDFRRALPHSLTLILVSLLDFFWRANPSWSQSGGMQLLAIISLLLDLLMMWHLCGGIAGLAEVKGFAEIAAAARQRRVLYAILSTIFLLTIFITRQPRIREMLAVPVVIFSLIVLLLILHLVRKAADEL